MRTLCLTLLVLLALPAPAVAADNGDPVRAGYDLYYKGDLLGAYRHFRALAGREPDNLAAAYGVLSSVWARDLTEESLEKEFERRAEQLIARAEGHRSKNSKDLEALFYLAQTHGLRAGYRFQRRKNLLGAARDASKSKKYSEAYRKQNPGHQDAYIALGLYNYYGDLAPAMLKVVRYLLLIPGGDRKLGLQQVERAARHGEMWSTQAKLELVQIYSWLEGRVEDGLQVAEKLRRDYPDNPLLTLKLARLYAGPVLEDPVKAAEQFTRILQRAQQGHPHYPASVQYKALLGLAEVRARQWELDEAIAMLHPAIETKGTKPSWVAPRSLLARARYRALLNQPQAGQDTLLVLAQTKWKKWHEEARAQLDWIRARRNSGEAVRFAELIPGNRLVAQGRRKLARTFFEQQRRAHPQDWQVRYRLARLTLLEGRTNAATIELREIVRHSGRRAPAWLKAGAMLHLARIYDMQGRRTEAVKLYETVADDYEEEKRAALAARIGILTPYERVQMSAR